MWLFEIICQKHAIYFFFFSLILFILFAGMLTCRFFRKAWYSLLFEFNSMTYVLDIHKRLSFCSLRLYWRTWLSLKHDIKYCCFFYIYATVLLLLQSLFLTRIHKKKSKKGKKASVPLLLLFFSFCFGIFLRRFCSMHFSQHRSSRETIDVGSQSLKPDHDVGLSFLYRTTRRGSRLSNSAFPTYYSLAYLPMPYLPKNNTRSVHSNFQIYLYNFLERPAGFKCFIYHFTVYVYRHFSFHLQIGCEKSLWGSLDFKRSRASRVEIVSIKDEPYKNPITSFEF